MDTSNNCLFFNQVVENQTTSQYDAIIRHGWFGAQAPSAPTGDCITGLIGMCTSYVNKIIMPSERECVEWKWGQISLTIPKERVLSLKQLGV
jgi:hypothetical protein